MDIDWNVNWNRFAARLNAYLLAKLAGKRMSWQNLQYQEEGVVVKGLSEIITARKSWVIIPGAGIKYFYWSGDDENGGWKCDGVFYPLGSSPLELANDAVKRKFFG